ncbi:MAG: hypothetical protein J5661_07520 [Bacteroidaceae bacterium]|nr:hypothetical protein [Bacteroidaceae bacterium]
MKQKLLSLIIALFCFLGWARAIVPAVPANPIANEWYDCGDESGFSKFYFTLPTTDVNGDPLDLECLSYSIFIDNDQLFTFPSEDYTFDLDEDITEVPYELYSNAVDFHDYYIYLYHTNKEGYEPMFTENIGIQVYYTVNGVRNSSDIVYLYSPTISVVFKDDQNNSDVLTTNNKKSVDATLEGRTLYAGDRWNTLCLPFNLTADQLADSPLAGFEIRELDTEASDSYSHITGYEADTKKLWLNFKEVSKIEAGKPYLVKSTNDASNLVYMEVSGTSGFNNEGCANLVDGKINTKWCSDKGHSGYDNGWICVFKAIAPVAVTGYTLTTGGDTGDYENWERNPQKWTLEAKVGESDEWTLIDSRDVTSPGNEVDALPAANQEKKTYKIAIDKQNTYQYFRFKVSETGGYLMQLSELTLQGTYTPINIVNPVFRNVTINSSKPVGVKSKDGTTTFQGVYDPVVFAKGTENRSVLFLQNNNLYYPDGKEATTIGAFRAYFSLDGIKGGEPEEEPEGDSGVHSFVLNFGDGETGIQEIVNGKSSNGKSDEWYSIDGRKLEGKPTQGGVYISNGRKVLIQR